MGLSSWSGSAEMMYLLAIQPTSPCAQSLNCFFNKASEPWSSNRTTTVHVWMSWRRSQRAQRGCYLCCSLQESRRSHTTLVQTPRSQQLLGLPDTL